MERLPVAAKRAGEVRAQHVIGHQHVHGPERIGRAQRRDGRLDLRDQDPGERT